MPKTIALPIEKELYTVLVGSGAYNLVLKNQGSTKAVRVTHDTNPESQITEDPNRTLRIGGYGSKCTQEYFSKCHIVQLNRRNKMTYSCVTNTNQANNTITGLSIPLLQINYLRRPNISELSEQLLCFLDNDRRIVTDIITRGNVVWTQNDCLLTIDANASFSIPQSRGRTMSRGGALSHECLLESYNDEYYAHASFRDKSLGLFQKAVNMVASMLCENISMSRQSTLTINQTTFTSKLGIIDKASQDAMSALTLDLKPHTQVFWELVMQVIQHASKKNKIAITIPSRLPNDGESLTEYLDQMNISMEFITPALQKPKQIGPEIASSNQSLSKKYTTPKSPDKADKASPHTSPTEETTYHQPNQHKSPSPEDEKIDDNHTVSSSAIMNTITLAGLIGSSTALLTATCFIIPLALEKVIEIASMTSIEAMSISAAILITLFIVSAISRCICQSSSTTHKLNKQSTLTKSTNEAKNEKSPRL